VIGFLALFGIAVRTGLMLIRHIQELERAEGAIGHAELVRRGVGDRLGPILTTASALAVVSLPFVILGARPGLEVVHPMAVVLLGGLVTTTLLSLFVIPTMYLRFAAPAKPSATPEDDLLHRWAGVTPETAATSVPDGELVPADGNVAREASDPQKETAS
jgi:Cu/Ag efflux pump CusA